MESLVQPSDVLYKVGVCCRSDNVHAEIKGDILHTPPGFSDHVGISTLMCADGSVYQPTQWTVENVAYLSVTHLGGHITPTCDVRSSTFPKRLVTANHTHTWWYNMSPLRGANLARLSTADSTLMVGRLLTWMTIAAAAT